MTAEGGPRPRFSRENPFAWRWWSLPLVLAAVLFICALHVLLFLLLFGSPGKNAVSMPMVLEPPPIEIDLEPVDSIPALTPPSDTQPREMAQASEPVPEDRPVPPPPTPPAPETEPDTPEDEPDDAPPPDDLPLPEEDTAPDPLVQKPEKTEKPDTEKKAETPKPRRPAKPHQPEAPPPSRAQPRSAANLPPPGALPGRTRSTRESWRSRVMMHLDQHKKYPPVAVARREQGEGIVRFVVDRQGRVRSVQLLRSTGYMLLDREVHDLMRRAQPLPLPPDDTPGDSFEIEVPVRFRLY
ncbi:energy transducer TonB [Phaeovibrio sulfidiphilus]|uniref:Energy transducer TonB n=1 Tax=Phaeovibrio sulfidiphilus TaxID=1220600 RepID=A0A8J6YPB6_9PROT|nr:energy transducer TonB [Phaeovibrio sulfidiphilus]MBE1236727.1 energy transducer TonB [Phaeovibrio sulfidiphilus]